MKSENNNPVKAEETKAPVKESKARPYAVFDRKRKNVIGVEMMTVEQAQKLMTPDIKKVRPATKEEISKWKRINEERAAKRAEKNK